MTIQEIRKLYDARPFRPFDIHTADGRKIRVAHPEFMATAPAARTVVVYQTDGTCLSGAGWDRFLPGSGAAALDMGAQGDG